MTMILLPRCNGLLSRRLVPPSFSRCLASVRTMKTTRTSASNTSTTSISNSSSDDSSSMILQRLGEHPYGTREYRLVLREHPDTKVASLRAHCNMIFGACIYDSQGQAIHTTTNNNHNTSSTPESSTDGGVQLSRVCLPLLDMALEDAHIEGEQPQALATLHGLCDWVAQRLDSNNNDSEALLDLANDTTTFEAVRAIATGVPRPGHSVVGQGTYRDGQAGWEAVAQEYVQKGLAQEVKLYQARGGTVVEMEHLADTHPAYLKSAGGTMARLFFLCDVSAPTR